MERLSDYDYDLPENLIAQLPLEDRSASKLLRLDKETGNIQDCIFRDVVDFLEPGDLLVLNDTRVTALRIFGHKPTGANVEALLLTETAPGTFTALVRPGKRLKPGAVVEFEGGLIATVSAELEEPIKELTFQDTPGWRQTLLKQSRVPLPPYITAHLDDPDRYQTVYAATGGSAAAPTAGLHFTQELLAKLTEKGIQTAHVSLDVSIDTFRPVTVDDVTEHKMHGEICRVPEETVRKVQETKGRIIAVGTTTARTLESFADEREKLRAGEMSSTIFIRPGYKFRVIDGMFTNFHMPKTTMLMMISALAGRQNIMRAYTHAIQYRYRFLSFGDSMLIL